MHLLSDYHRRELSAFLELSTFNAADSAVWVHNSFCVQSSVPCNGVYGGRAKYPDPKYRNPKYTKSQNTQAQNTQGQNTQSPKIPQIEMNILNK